MRLLACLGVVALLAFGACSDKGGEEQDIGGPANPFPTGEISTPDGQSADTSVANPDVGATDTAVAAQDSVASSDATSMMDTAQAADTQPGVDTAVPQDTAASVDTGPVADTWDQCASDTGGPQDTGGGIDSGGGNSDDNPCQFADPPTGKGVPFKGLTYTAKTGTTYNFTCTKCPGGIAGVEGTYRYYDTLKWNLLPNTPQAFTPSGAADIDTMTFEGNWFTISRRNLNTGQIETASGYYFCPDPAELAFAKKDYFNTVWVYETIQGNTMFNTKPGTVVPGHMGGQLDALEIQGVPNWNANMGGICPGPDCLHYCQVGSVIDGVPCTAPW